jgi:ATPase subunit of ABC transporter with duplicated ATPase domains
MYAASAKVKACAPRVTRRRDAARVSPAACRAPRATPVRAASGDAAVETASDETKNVPRGDTAGAMMVLRDVRMTVGDRDLLVRANLRVEPGEVVGLVGANGCGKSTLLRAVCGSRDIDAGVLLVAQNADVGYLEQTAVSGSKRTVAEEARSRMTHVRDAERALRDAEAGIAAGAKGAENAFLAAQERWEAVGGNAVERRVSDVLTGLGFQREAWDRPCAALSGGWQMRVALARLLLSPAGDAARAGINGGFLLLDEPTNHLDAGAKRYLGEWLTRYKGTALIVSHDAQFLEKGVDRLVEVRASKLHGYSGSYARFLEERAERRKIAASAAEKEMKKVAKLKEFVARNSARASTAAAARSRAKQLIGVRETLEGLLEDSAGRGSLDEDGADVSGPGDSHRVTLQLPKAPACASEALILENAAVGYDVGTAPLFANASLTARRGDRILVVGANGAGKSTLLRTLAGGIRCREGGVRHGEGELVGYFSQDLAQELPGEEDPLTHVLRVARAKNPAVTAQTARAVLGALGLTGNAAVDRKIANLSGGEKARVALAAFVLRPVNVLLLDEASNHLDTAALDALTEALRDWDGAVVAVTHNKQFAEALAPTAVVRVEAGTVTVRVAGGELSKKDFSPDAKQTGGVAGAVGREDVRKARAQPDGGSGDSGARDRGDGSDVTLTEEELKEERKKCEKLLREARNAPGVIEKIERALAVLDEDIGEIDARMVKCGSDVACAQEVQKERDVKTDKQALYYAEWERLEAVMEEAESILASRRLAER